MSLRFLERTPLVDHARTLALSSYAPELNIKGLLAGIDNVRHDVYLSARFNEVARQHIAFLIEKYGDVEDLSKEEFTKTENAPFPRSGFTRLGPEGAASRVAAPVTPAQPKPGDVAAEFKKALADLQLVSLNTAKSQSNISLDLLAHLAVIKTLRSELTNQYSQVLERCRTRLKSYEGPRAPSRAIEMRERFLRFQISKKSVLRKAGNEILNTLREVEKETVGRMRRTLFGDAEAASYDLFLNRLLFTEDGRDDQLNAEHYVMLGNYDRDPDRFQLLDGVAKDFLRSLGFAESSDDPDALLDSMMNLPENAQELVAAGTPQEASPKARAQKAMLAAWTRTLEKAGVLEHIIASYDAVPLLAEYGAILNPQQIKNALISRPEFKRIEPLLAQHGRLSSDKIPQSALRIAGYSSTDRGRYAGRFLMDFMRYHRDVRRLEALNSALDSVNVVGNERLRELSAINNTLYEFVLPHEQRPTEDKVVNHVILKADIRDSTLVTRTLFERGLNPASYFSLNFYDPINTLLPKYQAAKVFIEGDAVILAMFEHEGQTEFGVARCCMLSREIIDIVTAYNEKSRAAGLPSLELGIGLCYQETAPMYLMDGTNRIMISNALNLSDRLSGTTKPARRYFVNRNLPFNVFTFQTVEDADTGGAPEEFLMRYNFGGIHMNSAAFDKLQLEISLQQHIFEMPMLWGQEKVTLYTGLVPVAPGVFRRIVIREACIAHINAADFTLRNWTNRKYYEVCTAESVYEQVERTAAASR